MKKNYEGEFYLFPFFSNYLHHDFYYEFAGFALLSL